MNTFIKKNIWYLIVIAFAMGHFYCAFSYNYSNRYLHSLIILIILGFAFFFPRGSAATLGILSFMLMLGIAWKYFNFPYQPRIGEQRTAVVKILGPAHHSFKNYDEAKSYIQGLAYPNPALYSKNANIECYARGDPLLWIFYENDQVTGNFIGGS